MQRMQIQNREEVHNDPKQEQPPDKKFIREKRTEFTNGYEIRLIIGIAACILIAPSLVLKWASPHYIGVDFIMRKPVDSVSA